MEGATARTEYSIAECKAALSQARRSKATWVGALEYVGFLRGATL